MKQCLKCRKYEMEWHNNNGICNNCGETTRIEEYKTIKTIKTKKYKRQNDLLNEVSSYYDILPSLEKMTKSLAKQEKELEELQKIIESGNIEEPKTIGGDLSDLERIEFLVKECNPPEFNTAAYIIRSNMESWLKYKLGYDFNIRGLYPDTWRDRNKYYLYKEFSKEFFDTYNKYLFMMNKLLHHDHIFLAKSTVSTDSEKLEYILDALKFIKDEKIYCKDIEQGHITLLSKTNENIVKRVKILENEVRNYKYSKEKIYRVFKTLDHAFDYQDKLIDFIQSENIQLPTLNMSKKQLAQKVFDKYGVKL